MPDPAPKSPERILAERMARELDVHVDRAEAAVRNLIHLGLIYEDGRIIRPITNQEAVQDIYPTAKSIRKGISYVAIVAKTSEPRWDGTAFLGSGRTEAEAWCEAARFVRSEQDDA